MRFRAAGIDHDIKLWSPTAEEAHPPGEEAEEIMENNCMESGPRHLRERPVRISSQMIAQILSMQHLPIGRAHRFVSCLREQKAESLNACASIHQESFVADACAYVPHQKSA